MMIAKNFQAMRYFGGNDMKRYIRNSGIKNCINLVVDFCYDCSEDVKASVDVDLSDEEQLELLKHEVDSDFEGFIQLVVRRIKAAGYEFLEEPEHSLFNGSNSWYFVICNKNDYEELTVNLILNVRVSDHRLSRHKNRDKEWDRYKAREEYYQRELENYRILNEKFPEDVSSTLLEIKVGGTVYKNFLSASNHVIKEIKQYI